MDCWTHTEATYLDWQETTSLQLLKARDRITKIKITCKVKAEDNEIKDVSNQVAN